MARFTVYRYTMLGGWRLEVLSLVGPGSGREPAGTIEAPEGSAIYKRPGSPAKLKVPKSPANPHEFHVYSAADAVEAAKDEACGMAWEPAGEAVVQRAASA